MEELTFNPLTGKLDMIESFEDLYVNITGDTMTGNLTIQNRTTSSSAYIYGYNSLVGVTLGSDTAALDYTITAQNALSTASTNTTGGDIILQAGDGVGSTRLNDGIVHINGYKQKITYTSDYSPADPVDYSEAALWLDVSTSGTTGATRRGVVVDLKAGFTGSGHTQALAFDNQVAGTDTTYSNDSSVYGYRLDGNRGVGGYSRATTTGHNVGVLALAGGGAVNYGGWFAATINKTNAVNIGVFGSGLQTAGTPAGGARSVGGYFTLLRSASAPSVSASAGAIISNGGFSGTDILRLEDGTTTAFIFQQLHPLALRQVQKALS